MHDKKYGDRLLLINPIHVEVKRRQETSSLQICSKLSEIQFFIAIFGLCMKSQSKWVQTSLVFSSMFLEIVI